MKATITSGLLILSLSVAGTVCAQAPAAKVPSATAPAQATDFPALDKNKDGFISAAEAEPAGALHDVFESLDKNQDGKLSATEYLAWSGADKAKTPMPVSPATGPSGSSGTQHMPDAQK